ncbi:MAG: hypothetical protein LBD45_02805, partial [Bacteroidales bacterium]|nr:hypothetical protein [Bacteroidales bacterium]
MMKTVLKIWIGLMFATFGMEKASGQIEGENLFRLQLNAMQEAYKPNTIVHMHCEQKDFYVNLDTVVAVNADTYYIIFNDKPISCTISNECGSSFVNYDMTNLMMGGDLCLFHCYFVYCFDLWFDGPAIIKDIYFVDAEDNKKNENYGCPNDRIKIELEMHGDGSSTEVEIKTEGSSWRTISSFSYYDNQIYINFPSILNPYQQFTLRTRRHLHYDTDFVSLSTSTKTFYYLPPLQFPAGTDLVIDPPKCQEDNNTTIKIPYAGSTHYIITMEGNYDTRPGGPNNDKITKTDSYYVLSKQLATGSHTIKIEYPDGVPTPCYFQTSFTVPEIPSFTVSNFSYPDRLGDYEMTKHGGTGRVSFYVEGSYTPTILV